MMSGWEASVEKIQEFLGDIGADILAKRWVEPGNVAFSTAFSISVFIIVGIWGWVEF